MVPQNPESMPQDSLTHTQLGIPDSTPPENALVPLHSDYDVLHVAR